MLCNLILGISEMACVVKALTADINIHKQLKQVPVNQEARKAHHHHYPNVDFSDKVFADLEVSVGLLMQAVTKQRAPVLKHHQTVPKQQSKYK